MRLPALGQLLLLAALTGCTLNNLAPSSNSPTPLNLNGNWQLQSTNVQSGSLMNNVLLNGALVSSGTTVTGTFRYSNLASGTLCGAPSQVITLSGSLDTSVPLVQTLTLTSAPFSGETLTTRITFTTLSPGQGSGTIQVTGGACPLPPSTAIGLQYATVTGTYAGSVTASPTTSTGGPASGTVTLAAAQSTTPAADGSFPLTATLAFAAPGCNTSIPLSGTASGPLVMLSSTLNPLTATSFVHLTAGVAPANPQIAPALLSAYILYSPAPCSATLTSTAIYNGNLTRQ